MTYFFLQPIVGVLYALLTTCIITVLKSYFVVL